MADALDLKYDIHPGGEINAKYSVQTEQDVKTGMVGFNPQIDALVRHGEEIRFHDQNISLLHRPPRKSVVAKEGDLSVDIGYAFPDRQRFRELENDIDRLTSKSADLSKQFVYYRGVINNEIKTFTPSEQRAVAEMKYPIDNNDLMEMAREMVRHKYAD